MEERIALLEKSFASFSQELKSFGELLAASFTKVDTNFAAVKKDLDILHKKVDLLRLQTNDGLGDVGVKIENLTDEISKINKVTNYEDIIKNSDILKN